ncbi:3-phosphoshikimate 1-carboxyvinyltransferase [Candidatus Aerophobetes bacterium]|uniref:3-phosphoshikimate 1-carboxyvinyltransferase n=2 Tax=root TaxID=1 RepID=A0A523TI36_UNCAE|nr:MAG: 3-phosphoshikimate 1-carboxyvinyltransferase [Candidatus Aerophobetes bacterium]
MSLKSIQINPARHLKGEITVPGDKSITHRALIFASIARGKSMVKGLQKGKDCLATLNALKMMGIHMEEEEDRLVVYGQGLSGLREPPNILDCGNSGTTVRLLAGLLAPQKFYSVLSGDQYLRKRPMQRVVEPLRKMGARVFGRENGEFPPLTILGGKLKAIDHSSPIPSAQVKSCILLAGLYAKDRTSVIEPYRSRDHTERMLKFLGAKIEVNDLRVSVEGNNSFSGANIWVPGDLSAASFFMGGAAILKRSKLKILQVGLNPTRRGFIDVLLRMGADIKILNMRKICEEEVGDIEVRGGNLRGTVVQGGMISRLIDEIPILAVVACFAKGETIIRDARELRVKETDRIGAIKSELTKMGAQIEEKEDGMVIKGVGKLEGAQCQSHGDHRMAMALIIAGLSAKDKSKILGSDCIDTSFPGFWRTLGQILVQ